MSNPKKGTATKGSTLMEEVERKHPGKDETRKRGELKVWEKVQRMMPKTPKDVLTALHLDLETHGMHDRIKILPDGRIIDGNTRFILTRDIPQYSDTLPVRVYDVDDATALDIAFALQYDRRSVSGEDREKLTRKTLLGHADWTDRRIAERCGVSPSTVGKYRREMEKSGDIKTPKVQEGRGGKTAKKETKATRKTAAKKTAAKKATQARPNAPKKVKALDAAGSFLNLLERVPSSAVLQVVDNAKPSDKMLPKKMTPEAWERLQAWHRFLAWAVVLDPSHGNAKK